MGRLRLKGKMAGPYWVYPRLDIEDTRTDLNLIIQLNAAAGDDNFLGQWARALLIDADGNRIEPTQTPDPEQLPTHGGPSRQTNAEFSFPATARPWRQLLVTLRDDSVTFNLDGDEEEDEEESDEIGPFKKLPVPGDPIPVPTKPKPVTPDWWRKEWEEIVKQLPKPDTPWYKKTWFIVLIIVLVIILVLLAIFFAFPWLKRKLTELYKWLKKKLNRKKCCMKSGAFQAPANRKVTKTPTQLTESFEMRADFGSTGKGCSCKCCQYRQYVRGKFTSNGKKKDHKLPGGDLSETDFLEDGIPNEWGPGKHGHYGHREEPHAAGDAYTNPDRATGCTYRGSDEPGLWGGKANTPCTVELEFLGVIVDVCKDTVVATKSWKVSLSRP